MGAKFQMLQFAKEDLNLKRKCLEQLETSDAVFCQNIPKAERATSGERNFIEWIKAPIFLETVLAIEIM